MSQRSEERSARGRLARATALHGAEHPRTRAVREEWRSARWVAAVAAVAAEAPPLDAETRAHVRRLLAPVVGKLDGRSEAVA